MPARFRTAKYDLRAFEFNFSEAEGCVSGPENA
jgi:hypothetical protein